MRCAGKAQAWFAGISIAALPFSYCGPVVTGACGLGALTAHALRERFRLTDLRRLALLAALWASIVVLWQLIAVNPSTLLQFTGFAGSYEPRYIALTRPESWLNVKQFIAVLEPALSNVAAAKIIALLCCVPWIVGAMIGWRGRIFEHVTCLAPRFRDRRAFYGTCLSAGRASENAVCASRVRPVVRGGY